MEVVLTQIEREVISLVGLRRWANNVRQGLFDRNKSGRDGERLHLLGYAGEWAFCKLVGVMPDMRVEAGEAVGQDFDLRLPGSGRTVDVKTTDRANGNLIAPSHKGSEGHGADVYVLMWSKGVGRFEFAGWCEHGEFITPGRLRPLRGGVMTYFMPASELRSGVPE